MNVKNHPNYYLLLLSKGAKVIEPLKMRGGSERAKGRIWEASAKLRFKGIEYHLVGTFLGGLAETDEVASANLNIDKVLMSVEGGAEPDVIQYNRSGYELVLLDEGVYVIPDKNREARKSVRSLFPHNMNTVRYVGIANGEDKEKLEELGYKLIVAWY